MRKKDPPIRVGEGGMVDLAEAAVRQYHPGRGNRGEADTPWHAWDDAAKLLAKGWRP